MTRCSLLLVLMLVGCIPYVDATSTRYDGVEKFSPTDPATVQVLDREPKQRHERLGEVKLDISIDPPASVADIDSRLREEAAKMGANAIYVIDGNVSHADKQRKLVYRGQLDGSRPSNDVPVTGKDLRAALDAVLYDTEVSADQKPSVGCNIKWRPGNEPAYFG